MLRLRRLQIVVQAATGEFAVDLSFQAGLNIIRADNTSGKSTCVQSIIYALGLDAMLTARQHQLPLPPALTSKIFDRRADQDVEVSSAAIWLEIENKGHRVATLYRSVKGLGDNRLIRVFENVTIDQAKTNKQALELFARVKGAATLEHGFDRWLAEEFLQWKVPEAEKTDGSKTKLGPTLATVIFMSRDLE